MDRTRKIYLDNHELTELDTSSRDDKYRLTSPRADVQINNSTKRLIQFIDEHQGQTASYIINHYSANNNVSRNSINKTLKRLFKKGILVQREVKLNVDHNWKKDDLSYRGEMENLWFRYKLFDVDSYSGFFEKLGFTFSKPFIAAALVSFFILDAYFFYSMVFSNWIETTQYYSSFDYLFLLPLSEFMILFHELGHAAAIKRHQLPMPKGIGIGLYYFLVVLYADTHESWNLTRPKRAVVSFAGIYWNIILLVFLIPACLITKSAALKDFILLIHISAISVFNPFLKMDGYWLLTDLLGVVNLHKKARKYFKGFFWEQGKDAGELSDPFKGYPDRVKHSVVIYGLVYFLFLGAFLGFFFYRTGLIITNFEAEVLGRFQDIVGAKAGAQGNVAQKINYLIRNIAILTGALMVTINGGRRVFSFFREAREDK